MSRTNPKPTRLALLFYAAFAAWYVQDRYASPNFYRLVVGEFLEIGLDSLTWATFLILTLGAFIRSARAKGFPWRHAVAATGALVMAELIWRYGVDSLPGNDFKFVALAIDFAQPIIAALGVAAIVAERKVHHHPTSSPHQAHQEAI